MSIEIDRRIAQDHFPNGKEFFLENNVDTVEVKRDGKKSYVHFDGEGVETFNTKCAFRRALSQETGGTWIEERAGKKRYFIANSGWLRGSYRQVTKEECLNKLEAPTTLQKVLGLGLGILALAPGVTEFARYMPFGSQEAALGLLAMQQKSVALGILGRNLISGHVNAQAVGTEFQVNTNAVGTQWFPSIAPMDDGGFIVSWSSPDGGDHGVFAQIFDANATKVGPEFQVNTYTALDQASQSIGILTNSEFVITWNSNLQDGSGRGIFGQKFDNSSNRAGPEFQVNNFTANGQQGSSVSGNDSGKFIVIWSSWGQDSDSFGIFAQMFENNGTKIGPEFQINEYTNFNQENGKVALLGDDSFIIVWQSHGQDGDRFGIFAQRLNSSGAKTGSEFQVNTYTVNEQVRPQVAALRNSQFVVTWESSSQDGDLVGIFGQRFGNNGTKVGSEFQVNTYTENFQSSSSVQGLENGGFVVVWHSNEQDGSGYGIFGQRYDATGVELGTEFQINTYTAFSQNYPVVAPLKDGGFVVAWDSAGQDGDGKGIFGQRYDADGNRLAPPVVPTKSTPVPSSQIPQSSLINSSLLPVSTSISNFSSSFPTSVSRTVVPTESAPVTSSQSPQSSLVNSSLLPVSTSTSNFSSSFPTSVSTASDTPLAVSTSHNNATFSVQASDSASPMGESTRDRTISSSSTQISSGGSSNMESTLLSASSTTKDSTILRTTSSRQIASSVSTNSFYSTSSSLEIPALLDIHYGEIHLLILNGQVIGTYSILGGDGLYSSANVNIIVIELASDHQLQDGDTVTLFTVPEGEEEPMWEDVVLNGVDESSCITAEGVFVEDQDEHSYQLVFNLEADTCNVNEGGLKFSVIPALTSGGLV